MLGEELPVRQLHGRALTDAAVDAQPVKLSPASPKTSSRKETTPKGNDLQVEDALLCAPRTCFRLLVCWPERLQMLISEL